MRNLCETCILSDHMPNVTVENGQCNMCCSFVQLHVDWSYLQEQALFLIDEASRKGCKYPAVVAFSGGKDSSASLYFAVKELGIRPLAVTVDNGFLSPQAIDNGRKLTDQLGVDWILLRQNLRRYHDIMLEAYASAQSPCPDCSLENMRSVAEIAREKDIPLILTGHETLTTYDSKARVFTASAIYAAGEAYELDEGFPKDIQVIRMRAVFRITENQVHRIVERLPWKRPVNVGGTSCDILAFLLNRFHEAHGYNPYAYEYSEMIRMGFITRDEAIEMAKCPPVSVAEQHRLLAKLGLSNTSAE